MGGYIIQSGDGYLIDINEYGTPKMTNDIKEAKRFPDKIDAIYIASYLDELGYYTEIINN